MSKYDDDDQPRPNNKKPDNLMNEKLWQELEIDFHLEAFKFPDNKIYGNVKIIPESSRKLIKKLILVVNKTIQIPFDPHIETLAASGFNTNSKKPSVYIEAIPQNEKWVKEPKRSHVCYFYFTGKVFALSPTISFVWPPGKEKPEPNLVIKWHHLGDKMAQKYILYLDDVDIQYIRQKQIDDAFDVHICGLKCGEKHTFQLVAKLNNGKETYRSDLMEFTVPDNEPTNEEIIECITVLDEPPPPDLPIIIASKDDITEDFNHDKDIVIIASKDDVKEDFNPDKDNSLPPKKKPNGNNNNIYTCCDKAPHDIFPGVEHYFNNIPKQSLPPKQTSTKDQKAISTDETHDDDDDVITSNNQK